jgi:hypothetical protein
MASNFKQVPQRFVRVVRVLIVDIEMTWERYAMDISGVYKRHMMRHMRDV